MRGNGKALASGPQQVDSKVQDLDYSGDCPFCNISLAYPSVNPLDDPQEIARILDHEKTSPPCVVIYSGEHVMAFLDIQPLTWGHTLVVPRRHRVKMGDLEAVDAAEVRIECRVSVLMEHPFVPPKMFPWSVANSFVNPRSVTGLSSHNPRFSTHLSKSQVDHVLVL